MSSLKEAELLCEKENLYLLIEELSRIDRMEALQVAQTTLASWRSNLVRKKMKTSFYPSGTKTMNVVCS